MASEPRFLTLKEVEVIQNDPLPNTGAAKACAMKAVWNPQ